MYHSALSQLAFTVTIFQVMIIAMPVLFLKTSLLNKFVGTCKWGVCYFYLGLILTTEYHFFSGSQHFLTKGLFRVENVNIYCFLLF